MHELFVIESTFNGLSHSNVNSATLSLLLEANSSMRINFFGGESHISAIRDQLSAPQNSRIVFHPVDYFSGSWFSRWFRFVCSFLQICRKASKNQKSILVLSLNSYNYFAIRAAMKWFANVKILGLAHNILDLVPSVYELGSFKSILKTILTYFQRYLFYNLGDNFAFLVLGEQIKNGIVSRFPHLAGHVWALEHPYFFSNIARTPKDKDVVKIGLLGVGSEEKGVHDLIRLSEHFKANSGVRFYLLGKSFVDTALPASLHAPFQQRMCSYEELSSMSAEMTFFIFLMNQERYALRASGTFFDAVSFERPIITFPNNYIDHYFDLLGDIGYQVSDYNSLVDLIGKLIAEDRVIYQQKCENLKRAKQVFIEKYRQDIFKILAFYNNEN